MCINMYYWLDFLDSILFFGSQTTPFRKELFSKAKDQRWISIGEQGEGLGLPSFFRVLDVFTPTSLVSLKALLHLINVRGGVGWLAITRWWNFKHVFVFTLEIGEDESMFTIIFCSKGLVKNHQL